MPLSGTLDTSTRLENAPVAANLADQAVVLERAEVLQVMFEIDSAVITSMLPAALHPTDPTIATFVAIKTANSQIGSFTVAQTRVGCRAGVRPRGFVSAGYVDNLAAEPTLADRWGFGLAQADVVLERRYHDVALDVALDGRTILTTSLVDPVPLSGAEIQFAASMHLARVVRDGSQQPRLVQVDPELKFHRAMRGRARLDTFDATAWGDERIAPVYPISAWYAVCDVELPRIRYICDPDLPAFQGTEQIG